MCKNISPSQPKESSSIQYSSSKAAERPHQVSSLPSSGGTTVPPKWQRQLNTWQEVKDRFKLNDSRYDEFEYLLFLDIEDPFVSNYVEYHLGKAEPLIRGRLRNHYNEWVKLGPPAWILSLVSEGLKIPFIKEPPIMVLPNNKSAIVPENIQWVRETILLEHLAF